MENTHMQVAKTILSQLGGSRFLATGKSPLTEIKRLEGYYSEMLQQGLTSVTELYTYL